VFGTIWGEEVIEEEPPMSLKKGKVFWKGPSRGNSRRSPQKKYMKKRQESSPPEKVHVLKRPTKNGLKIWKILETDRLKRKLFSEKFRKGKHVEVPELWGENVKPSSTRRYRK